MSSPASQGDDDDDDCDDDYSSDDDDSDNDDEYDDDDDDDNDNDDDDDANSSFSRAAGCRLPWDSLSDQSRPVCTSLHQFEHFARQYDAMRDASMRQILNLTRCQKPCSYKKYVLISGPLEAAYTAYSHFSVELWMVTTDITSLTETLIYPWTGKNVEFPLIENIFLDFFKKLKVSDIYRKSESFRLQREI